MRTVLEQIVLGAETMMKLNPKTETIQGLTEQIALLAEMVCELAKEVERSNRRTRLNFMEMGGI